METKEENKIIYDMGFVAGVKSRPAKHVKEHFINLKLCNQNKVLINKLMEFLVANQCNIPEFFTTSDRQILDKSLTIYLMGLQNGSLYNK